MDALARYLDRVGMDASALDEAIADYIIELAREGGTEEETWSVVEGCYPELEEVREPIETYTRRCTMHVPCVCHLGIPSGSADGAVYKATCS